MAIPMHARGTGEYSPATTTNKKMITIVTDDPAKLLAAIKKAIDNKDIATWSYDSAGDFTHTPDQWKGKGWFRPTTEAGVLKLSFLKEKNVDMTDAVRGVYHGRFIESIMTHFQEKYNSITVPA